MGRPLIKKPLVRRGHATIKLPRGSKEDRSRTDGENVGCPIDQLFDRPEQIEVPNQRHHAGTPRDEEGIKLLFVCSFLESLRQGKGGQNAKTIFDGGLYALRRIQVADVDELEGVVVASGDDGAQRPEEI